MVLHDFMPIGVVFSTLPQQLVNGILLGAIYALIALGYTMVYGVLKLINFAHGEVYMLGAYAALLISWALGFGPNVPVGHEPASSWIILALMIVGSMVVCALIGVIIERFAYRPMRRHSRIATLITAIGVSMSLQYGGALVLPNSPPPSISEKTNPYRGSITMNLTTAPQTMRDKLIAFRATYAEKEKAFDDYLAKTQESEFNLSPPGEALKKEAQAVERSMHDAEDDVNNHSSVVVVQNGQLIMLLTAVLLMFVLRLVVMKTAMGRAMRAVSLDFDSASLMGVNVDTVVTFTFIVGSALAGAGAMMQATFLATPLTSFFGLQPGVKAFVAAVLGGIGNIPGAVLGGLLMGVAETLVVWLGYSQYRDAIAFVVLIAVLLFRPGGLMGSFQVEKV